MNNVRGIFFFGDFQVKAGSTGLFPLPIFNFTTSDDNSSKKTLLLPKGGLAISSKDTPWLIVK
ncbi:MAG: hypothetical protein AAGM27_09595, partial [Cyanobacteria bacterium J06554_3]